MPRVQGVEDEQKVVGAVYVEASSVDVAVEALTPPAEATCPHRHHRRRRLHSCRGSLLALYVHVVVHTIDY